LAHLFWWLGFVALLWAPGYGGDMVNFVSRKETSDIHRQRIADSGVLARLIEVANGDRMMGKQQFEAHRLLLAKILPDLKAVEVSGEVNDIRTITIKTA
jgi:hypothetical protein